MGTPEETLSAIASLRAERESGKFFQYFPICTDQCDPTSQEASDHVGMCRVLYPKHMAWFASREGGANP